VFGHGEIWKLDSPLFRSSQCCAFLAPRCSPRRGIDTKAPPLAKGALEQIDADIAAGSFSVTAIDWTGIMERAEGLSGQHTTTAGVRSLDLFHIASAISLKVKAFLTFDARQFVAAKAAGLNARIL
jgi:hypothetical protein